MAKYQIPEIVGQIFGYGVELAEAGTIVPLGKIVEIKLALSRVAIVGLGDGRMSVRMIWYRNEGYWDQGPGDGTGSIKEWEEVEHDGWSDELFADLGEALKWGRSHTPQEWRKQRKARIAA